MTTMNAGIAAMKATANKTKIAMMIVPKNAARAR